uniref:Uncharacterized protein n=1 Tax=Dunaliella viridis TaxID=140095 RepID=D2SP69_9CHLO|nr:hypothetical protein [Dunaliella viridis]
MFMRLFSVLLLNFTVRVPSLVENGWLVLV